VFIVPSSHLFPKSLMCHARSAWWLETKSYARIVPPPPRFTRQPQKEKMFLALLFFAGVIFSKMERAFFFLGFYPPSIRAGGGTGLILIWQEKSGIPPNPPLFFSAFLLLKRNGNGSRRAKIPFPQPPSFLPARAEKFLFLPSEARQSKFAVRIFVKKSSDFVQ